MLRDVKEIGWVFALGVIVAVLWWTFYVQPNDEMMTEIMDCMDGILQAPKDSERKIDELLRRIGTTAKRPEVVTRTPRMPGPISDFSPSSGGSSGPGTPPRSPRVVPDGLETMRWPPNATVYQP